MNIKLKKNGYTVLETIIYVTILSVIYFLIINTLLSFNSSYRNIVALRIVDNAGIDSMERITRDIRGATSVNVASSTFGTSPGVLTLITTSGSLSTTTRFYLDNGVIKVDINGSYSGPLTLSSANVSSLTFSKMDSGMSSAIKIDMTISGNSGNVTKLKNYHSTVIMRGI